MTAPPFETLSGRMVAALYPGAGDVAARWQAAVTTVSACHSGPVAARVLGVSLRTLRRWLRWLRQDAAIDVPERMPGRRARKRQDS